MCICTRNRPEELSRALDSVRRSSVAVHQVVVSDDSTDDFTRALVSERYPEVVFVEGPRRGLGANRNAALDRVTGTHVLFIDDDVEMRPDFVSEIVACYEALPESIARATIVSGLELNAGRLVFPNDQDFLGFQSRIYGAGDTMQTIVINAAVFPASVFARVRFDERLVYGYDEVDIATRAVRCGYRIAICPEAVNEHFPALANRDYYKPFTEASRLYVTHKRYARTERRPWKALAFALLAPWHLLAVRLRHAPRTAITSTCLTVKIAFGYARSEPAI